MFNVQSKLKKKFLMVQGNVALKKSDFEEALKCYDEVLKLDSIDLDGLIHKGIILKVLKRNSEAFECFNKVLDIYPESDKAWINKADILADLGKYEEALECYNESLKLNLNPEVLNNKGKSS